MLLEAPSLFFVHTLAELSEFGQHCFVVGIGGDRITEGGEAKQQIPLRTASLKNLLEHREPRRDPAVLAHQFHPQAWRAASFSGSQGFVACQHFQQGGFAGSVGTNQSQSFTLSNVKIQFGEEGADSEILGRTHQADQTHGVPVGN